MLSLAYGSLLYINLIFKRNDASLRIISNAFNAISGLINSVAFALLVGRLDSKLIGLRTRFVAFLFLYSGIQPLFAIFGERDLSSQIITTLAIGTAFILKIQFFLTIDFLTQSGGLLTYFYCFNEVDRRADSVFSNRYEILIYNSNLNNKWTYLIRNEGKTVITGVGYFDNLDILIQYFRELRDGIANNKIIDPLNMKEVPGNYLFNLSYKDLTGYSGQFHDQYSAEEFKREFLEKFESCKMEVMQKPI